MIPVLMQEIEALNVLQVALVHDLSGTSILRSVLLVVFHHPF